MESIGLTEEDGAIIGRQVCRVIEWQTEPALFDMLMYGTGIHRIDENSVAVVMRAMSDYLVPI